MFGPKPPKKQPAPEPEPEDYQLDGMEKVAAHRALGLLDLGFTLPQVLILASKPDVVHEARELIDAGCPVEIAFDLLT